MPAILDVRDTFGAVLIGCFAAVALSGVVALQVCIYCRLYPTDKLLNKIMVAVVWALDITHTCLICTSIWKYLISNFGNVAYQGTVPITVALSIGVTMFLVVGRVASGLVTTVELARLQNFPAFTARFKSVFTLGLALSSAIDVIITFSMCFYLQENRQGLGTMDEVIDSIIAYTVNNGALTCVSTIVSMICWLTMPKNLIFMALHFVISKMYANSLLATLNMRQSLRGRAVPSKEGGHPMPVLFPDSFNRHNRSRQIPDMTIDFDDIESKGVRPISPSPEGGAITPRLGVQLHITVEKTVQYDVEHDLDNGSGPSSEQPSPGVYDLKHADV
ncbi:hypothetical protein B0F90DRAFT_1813705 [Multifurca ochricompacta]|uniref:DUF6534 domain-containing protein n=1 Tax=Multifurca ochricompacta TaxID=376703 RepID=A0AAD4MAK8_9AGAM|nr:hypothetical protein B0F90DRAFT_1813705 [Multifurca ochricompacta]